MRIGVLTSSYPRYPGDAAGVFVRSLMEHLGKLGHEMQVLAPYEPSVFANPAGRNVHHFRYMPLRSWHQLGYGLALDNDRRLRRRAYALIPSYLAAATVALLRLVRRIQPDVLHCHWVIPNGPVAALVSVLTNIPLVMTLHGSDVYVAERTPVARALARWSLRRSAVVTACSPDLAAGAVRLGTDQGRMVTIPWGADSALFRTGDRDGWRVSHAISPEATVVLTAGRLVDKKGIEHLVGVVPQVLARHPSTMFVVVGDGPLKDTLEHLAAALGVIDAFRFTGHIPWDEMPDALHAADFFVAPSVRDPDGNVDGLPTVILEAMAAGLPVVASDLAGIPLVVEEGVNGHLVPPGDLPALAQAIERLVADRDLRRRMGRESRQRVERELNWTAVATRFAGLFEAAQAGGR